MSRFSTIILVAFAAGVLGAAIGCSEDKHEKVRVEERQEPGEVKDTGPGEMVVE